MPNIIVINSKISTLGLISQIYINLAQVIHADLFEIAKDHSQDIMSTGDRTGKSDDILRTLSCHFPRAYMVN